MLFRRLALAIVFGAGVQAQSVRSSDLAQPVHPIDLARLEDRSQFAFLAAPLRDVEVISLGESIHLTREFPQVRLALLRYLHENLGFDTLGMEGSAEDIWVAQDRLLNSARKTADAEASLTGLFAIWNTADYRQLIEYEIASWRSPHPFYVAAYDIQPGTGKASGGSDVFRQLAARLREYAPAPAGFDESHWIDDLAPLTHACANYQPANSDRVEAAIRTLQRWVDVAAPSVAARFPTLPHAAVLALIPVNLEASLRLCQGLGPRDWGKYKGLRDANAALYALALKNVAPQHKLVLWAHLSHVSYNAEGSAVSVGEVLRGALGPRLYTIIPFAESGFTFLLFSDVNDDIGFAPVHGAKSALGARLSQLDKGDYFLDVRSAPDPLFHSPQSLWVEAGQGTVTLAGDLDAILWIKGVHAPDLLSRKTTAMFWALTAMHYRKPLIGGAAVLLGGSIWAVIRRRRGRRLRHAAHG